MTAPNIHHLATPKPGQSFWEEDEPSSEEGNSPERSVDSDDDMFAEQSRSARPVAKGGGAAKKGGMGTLIGISAGLIVLISVLGIVLVMFLKKQNSTEIADEDFGVPPTIQQPVVVAEQPAPTPPATNADAPQQAVAAGVSPPSAGTQTGGALAVSTTPDGAVQQGVAVPSAAPSQASASEIKDLKDQIEASKAKMSIFDERLGNLERELTSLVAVVKQSLSAAPKQAVKVATTPARTSSIRTQGTADGARKPESPVSQTVRQAAEASGESVQAAIVKPVIVKADIPNRLLQDVHVTQLVGSRAWVTEIIDGAEVETSLVAGDLFRGVRVQSISTQYREVLLADGRKIIRRK